MGNQQFFSKTILTLLISISLVSRFENLLAESVNVEDILSTPFNSTTTTSTTPKTETTTTPKTEETSSSTTTTTTTPSLGLLIASVKDKEVNNNLKDLSKNVDKGTGSVDKEDKEKVSQASIPVPAPTGQNETPFPNPSNNASPLKIKMKPSFEKLILEMLKEEKGGFRTSIETVLQPLKENTEIPITVSPLVPSISPHVLHIDPNSGQVYLQQLGNTPGIHHIGNLQDNAGPQKLEGGPGARWFSELFGFGNSNKSPQKPQKLSNSFVDDFGMNTEGIATILKPKKDPKPGEPYYNCPLKSPLPIIHKEKRSFFWF